MSGRLEMSPEVAAEIVEQQGSELNLTKVNAILQLAEQTEKLGAALDKIRLFVLKRAMPGDFVRFGDKVEMTGPGAERVAAALGVSFTGWKDEKTQWTDKHGDAYTWRYLATARLGDRVIELIEGRASSRAKFFGYENGAWKELADVSEADIRTSARRCVIKEGVKLLLGIRGIPWDEKYLREIGLDPAKVKTVEFGKRGEQATNAAAPGTPVEIKEVKTFSKKPEMKDGKEVKKGYTRFDVFDTAGAKYSTFSESIGKLAQSLIGKKALIDYTVGQWGNDIKELSGAPEDPAEAEPKA